MATQQTTISADIIAKCVPATSVDASRVDGLTLINVSPTKPSELATIYKPTSGSDNQWRIIGNLLEADFRGKACQAKQNGFSDFIKGNARVADPKKLSVDKMKSNLFDIRPYVMMEVKNPINNHRWDFTGGVATHASSGTDAEDAAYTAGARWKGTVTSLRNIPADIRWFGPGTTVTISSKGTGGVRLLSTYKVVSAEVISTDLWLYLVNISSHVDDPIYGLAADKRGDPTYGVLMRGLPNVTTAESHCDNIPGLNMTQFRPFWLQSTRRTIREDDEYLKYAAMIRANNPLFRTFGDVESVEYTRQVMEDYDNRLANTFLHNPALVNQTPEKYPSLDKVAFYAGDANSNTLTFSGRYQTYRANATGYLEQLAECEGDNGVPRLVDLLGQPLSLDELHRELYQILRIRKNNGLPGKVLELYMHSQFREKMIRAYVQYFKDKSIDTLRINMETKEHALGFTWNEIMLDWPSVQLRLVCHEWFDDVVDDHKATADAEDAPDGTFYYAGNLLMIPDWSTSYRMLLESGAVTMETGDPKEIARVDASFLCGPLMAPKQRVRHWYEIFTTVVECARSQIAYENFDDTAVLQTRG